MSMHIVGVRELKSRLSEYLRAVRGGAHVVVTDRGQPVARLLAADETDKAAVHAGVADLARRGVVRPASANARGLYPVQPRVLRGAVSSRELLDSERGEI